MKRTNDTIEMLQYQLRRYKAMRKGAACPIFAIQASEINEPTG